MKAYKTGNLLYLPISPNHLGEPEFYVEADANGWVYLSDLHTAEKIKKMHKAGEIEQVDNLIR